MTNHADSILDLARRCVASFSTADAAAQMGEANTAFGLAKILWAQDQAGAPPHACFIASPDSTITRNTNRWASGFGYGGKLVSEWPEPTVVLDAKPNACGMLVGGLAQAPTAEDVAVRLQEMLGSRAELQGIPVRWDFSVSNHFVDLFSSHSFAGAPELPPCVFIIHGSCHELREPTDLGPGLYWDKSAELMARADVVATPWGPLRLLRGAAARDYLEFFDRAAGFAAEKRLMAARALFGDFQLLANLFHQGLLSTGEVLLGCHHALWDQPLPLTLRPDLPSYLLKGLPNLAEDVIVRRLGGREVPDFVLQTLRCANIVPHGGGYVLDGFRSLRRAWSVGDLRFFELQRESSEATDILADPGGLPARYRGRQVLMLTMEWGLAQVAARLDPLLVIKA